MLDERLNAWEKVYSAKVEETIRRHPSQYVMKDHVELTRRTKARLLEKGLRSITINAMGWHSAAKHFGIANTYIAWEKWFDGTLTPRPID